MDTLLLIDIAVKYILGENIDHLEHENDRFFLKDIIRRISKVLAEQGCPTVDMLNLSIKIGELKREDCCKANIYLATYEYNSHRCAIALYFIARNIHTSITDPDPESYGEQTLSSFGETYSYDVCQACPAFLAAIHKVHTAGFTPYTILERAYAYSISPFGF